LLAELDAAFAGRPEWRVETVFVGGGTPTLLPVPELDRLFAALERTVQRPAEFTVEANPASLNDDKVAVLRAHGANRVSMGAQSFHADELQALDRIHSPADIAPSVDVIRRAGFEHLNLDLIFGIPGQTQASWAESLRRAVELVPDHLACYGLTYEPQTPLWELLETGLIRPVAESIEAELYLMAIDYLEGQGFQQYEISNFARPGAESRHNIRYWLNLPYIGIGPSAASYIDGRRWRNVPDTAEYVRRMASGLQRAIDMEQLSPLERAGEAAMLQLRLVNGIDRATFRAVAGFDPGELFADVIARHIEHGLLIADDRHIALTRKGRLVGDAVIADFLLPESG
jgi:oxygen-independent coproporphyrinogen-3 oxidase